MESTTNTPNFEKLKRQEPEKRVPMWLIATIITLSVIVIILVITIIKGNQNQKAEDVNQANDKALLTEEKTQLEGELREMIIAYDSLIAHSDSLDTQLGAEQERIRSLLKTQASNYAKIKMYQKELGTLREIMRSYIVQIDSLNVRNDSLTQQNIRVTNRYMATSQQLEETQKILETLEETVDLGKKLTTSKLFAAGYKDNKDKPKNSAKKLDQIRVDFTINENRTSEKGDKMIYLKITGPNEEILPAPEGESGAYEHKGQIFEYSEKRKVSYDNTALDVSIFWHKTVELNPGFYYCELYCEGHQIGAVSFQLGK
ncbi:MAG: hypothetical protein JW801_07925 [Bacteroidales bacterium]|nr:hypothetical protein [Bacteroidales bacterium]